MPWIGPGASSEARAPGVALAVLDNNVPTPLLRWWGRWRHVRSPVSARELMAQGVTAGPALGDALRRLKTNNFSGCAEAGG